MNFNGKRYSILSILILSITSVIVFILVSFIGATSLLAKLVFGSILYFTCTYLVLKSSIFTNKVLPFIIISFPPILAFIYINIFHFKASSISFPSSLFIVISTILGFIYYKSKSVIFPIILSLLLILWVAYFKELYNNKRLYNTIDQTVLSKYPQINLYDTVGISKQFSDNKYYFLDFWNSGCAPCFRLFPYIDSINKLADKSKFEFCTVNIPVRKEIKEKNYSILDSYEYSFTELFADKNSDVDSFKVLFYPTTLVVKNNHIIFRGDFKTAIKRFKVID